MRPNYCLKFKRFFCLSIILTSCLNLSAQNWGQVNDPPFFKHHTNGFGYNGKAYVFEGIHNNDGPQQISNELWEYTAASDSWVRLTDFPGPGRAIAIGDDWDNKYYYGFGSGENGVLNDLWVFDPVDTSFTELPACPCQGRSHPALIAHNDKVFVGTGSTFNGDLNDWWEYDILTQEWTQKPNVPGGVRHHPFFFAMDDYVYVGGGHVNNWLRFDPSNDEWTTIDNEPEGRVAGTQLNHNGKGLIIGGDDAFHTHVPNSQTFMLYDPQSEQWNSLPPLPNGSRWAPSSFIIDEVLYFFGGLSAFNETDSSMWKFDLDYLDCLPASGLNVANIDDNSADLFWVTNTAEVDSLKWRKLGESIWNVVLNPESIYSLNNLEVCQEYEFMLSGLCNSLYSFTNPFVFSTGGCCVNPEISVNLTTASTAEIEWNIITGIDEYEIRWKPLDASNWSTINSGGASIELNNLNDCTEYECQVKSVCSDPNFPFSESVTFLTKNCGVCLDVDYCPVSEGFDGSNGFIQKVGINGSVNITGNNNGYASFASPNSEEINIGETFELVLEPLVVDFSLSWNVWIDFNANGVFENNEMILEEEASSNEITRNILIPNSAEIGLTRMRVVYGFGIPNLPCHEVNEFNFGEAEDYCIKIVNPTSNNTLENDLLKISLYPNPSNGFIWLNSNIKSSDKYNIKIMNLTGVVERIVEDFELNNNIDLSNLSSGIYFITVENDSFFETHRIIKQN